MFDKMIFSPENDLNDDLAEDSTTFWKVLIVDDEEAVHVITVNSIKDITVHGKKLDIYSAKSMQEAKSLLAKHDDIALAIIDVVMETPTAGLDLVNYIRNDMKNDLTRLVIRTGEPSEAPEHIIIENYDINDYKEKSELTSQKLFTMIRSSIIQYEQIIKLADKYEHTYAQMTRHPVSGLPNRMKLNEILDTTGKKELLLLNIDRFSIINDSQGFEAGNQLLIKFGLFLENTYSAMANVFHLEGDCFVLYCKSIKNNLCNYENIGKIRDEINKTVFTIDGLNVHISVTIGLASHECGNLIQKAELALKEARLYGHGDYQKYSKDMNILKHIESTLIWKSRLHDAIVNNKLHTYYQPIVEIKTGRIIKYEALARLEYNNEIYTPNYFIDAAKCSGQLFKVFKVMFTNVCKMIKNEKGIFSVNVDKSDLMESGMLNFIEETLEEYKIQKGQITLEILENSSLVYNEKIHELLYKFRELGLLIAIDDFGANCSNYSQLTNIEFDFLKIDGQFIKDIDSNEKSKIVTKTIIDFANNINIPIIAEFIHSKEINDILLGMNIEYGQGYYFNMPLKNI